MDQPTDYPLKPDPSEKSAAESKELTYAELRDRIAADKVVTNDMIQSAVAQIAAAPVTGKTSPVKHVQS